MRKCSCISAALIVFLVFSNVAAFAQDPQPEEQTQTTQPQPQTQPQPRGQEGTKTPPAPDPGQIVRPSETASTPSTARRILTNFWGDQKAFFTSPFHINGDNAKWWGLFGVGTA